MQDAVLNLCRVKLRDQQRLAHGPLAEYPNKVFGDAVPRSGNASGGGQPGEALECKPGGPNDYIYVIIQPQGWEPLMRLVGREELIDDPNFATTQARLPHLGECFAIIEEWTRKRTKFEVMETLNGINVPCGPILDTRELLEDEIPRRARYHRRGRASRARRLQYRRLSLKALRFTGRGDNIAPARRTHRGDLETPRRLRRRRHQEGARRGGKFEAPPVVGEPRQSGCRPMADPDTVTKARPLGR